MNSVNMEKSQFQLGKTKVFIKAPESVSVVNLLYTNTLYFPARKTHRDFFVRNFRKNKK
jgi:myosin heavy subunit